MRVSKTPVVAGVCLAVLLGVGLRFYLTPDRALRGAAVDRRAIALRVLGEYLAERKPGSRALIIGNPFVLQPGQPAEIQTFEQAAVRGLEAGWDGQLDLAGLDYPELTPAASANPTAILLPPELTTPLSFMTTDGAWDQIRQRHPAAELWVSLIGLPAHVARLAVWREPKPEFALLLPDLRVLGDAATEAAFRTGKLLAVVLSRPGAPPESVARTEDYRAEFERRFLLVTAANYQATRERFPGLF